MKQEAKRFNIIIIDQKQHCIGKRFYLATLNENSKFVFMSTHIRLVSWQLDEICSVARSVWCYLESFKCKWVFTQSATFYLSKLPEQVNERSLAKGIGEAGMECKGGVLCRENGDPASLCTKKVFRLVLTPPPKKKKRKE